MLERMLNIAFIDPTLFIFDKPARCLWTIIKDFKDYFCL